MTAHRPRRPVVFAAALLAAVAEAALAAMAGIAAAAPVAPAPPISAAAAPASAAAVDLRSLPSVVRVWGRRMAADRIAVRRPAILVKSGSTLTALAVHSGQPIWSRALGEGSCCAEEILATEATVVAVGDGKLFLVNAADGTGRGQIDIAGGLSSLAGPPLVALSIDNELVAVDADSGQVTGRTPIAEEVNDLMVQDGYVVLSLANEADSRVILAGYTADTLSELWRVETRNTAPQFERVGGRIHVARFDGRPEILPVDPANGQLGKALPAAKDAHGEASWPPGILSLPSTGVGAAARQQLRRVDTKTGNPLWTTDLPCRLEAAARDQDALLASCDRGGDRGLLAVLSWTTGAIRQLAYGLPRGHVLAAGGDLVVVATDDEVAAFSSTRFGPPAASLSVDREVLRILLDRRGDDTPRDRGQWIADRLRELEPLGPAAYPFVARLLPKLGPTSLAAAADVLAMASYRPAAPALAARLAAGQLEEPQAGAGSEGWNPQFALLRGLAVLGGDAEVPVVAALLDAADGAPAGGRRLVAGAVRREALATLVALRSLAADLAVRAFLARPLPRQPVWSPPAPPNPTTLATRDPASFGATLPDGRRLVLFRHGYLGSPDDLWVAELDARGSQVGPARFTGLRLPADDDGYSQGLEPPQRLQGAQEPQSVPRTPRARVVPMPGNGAPGADWRIEVGDGAGRQLAAFSLSATIQDSDGDGLTDLVERRLRLDPGNPDTDGDGLRDAEDPAPNARLRQPLDDEQEMAAAVFRQFFQFEDGAPPEIAVVVSDFALEWRGRRQATITLDSREAARFLEETGGGGVQLISIHAGEPPVVAPVAGDPPGPLAAPRSDEKVYTLVLDRGRLHALVFRVVLRNLNANRPAAPRQWAVSCLRLAWAG